MYNNTLKSDAILRMSNMPGWRTNRKIIVLESDDWGSVRMSSLAAYEKLTKERIVSPDSHYNMYDALESNKDLEELFNLLLKFKDKNGNHPVITAVAIMANPDFDKIRQANYSEYYYEPFYETLKKYNAHDRVHKLWLSGIENHLFMPAFHGREHLNVKRWIHSLNSGNEDVRTAFDYGVTGLSANMKKGTNYNFQAAFDIDNINDNVYLSQIIDSGLALFESILGFKSAYFVPTNGPFNNMLEDVLYKNEIKFINSAKMQYEPMGNGRVRKHFRWLGKQNKYHQIYLTRNCFFEPSNTEFGKNRDWIDTCLHEIQVAFKYKKPALISSHRVNYVGYLHPENRERGLRELEILLSRIIKQWPDVEFLSSEELGNCIKNTNYGM